MEIKAEAPYCALPITHKCFQWTPSEHTDIRQRFALVMHGIVPQRIPYDDDYGMYRDNREDV